MPKRIQLAFDEIEKENLRFYHMPRRFMVDGIRYNPQNPGTHIRCMLAMIDDWETTPNGGYYADFTDDFELDEELYLRQGIIENKLNRDKFYF